MPDIQAVWTRIEDHAGETFRLVRGAPFTYVVSGGHVHPSRTNQQIPKSHFKKALSMVPLESTARLQHLRGPSFIFAILMDARIRQNEW